MTDSELASRRHRVVLIGDDEDIRNLLEAVLNHQRHFEVVGEACDGDEAVALARRLQPNAVVLDLALSGLDGLRILPLLRLAAPETKIVVYTSFADPLTLAAVLRAGADSYLDVSTTWAEIVPTLEALLVVADLTM
jgi:two-component system nitrate/nitrite response regulator NarP